jgi:hypothetical protein
MGPRFPSLRRRFRGQVGPRKLRSVRAVRAFREIGQTGQPLYKKLRISVAAIP